MTTDTNGYIAKAISTDDLISYLEGKYKNIRDTKVDNKVNGVSIRNHKIISIDFKDGKDERCLTSLIYDNPVNYYDDELDDEANIKYQQTFSLACEGNSVQIITGILKEFGGGYLVKDDSEGEIEYIK